MGAASAAARRRRPGMASRAARAEERAAPRPRGLRVRRPNREASNGYLKKRGLQARDVETGITLLLGRA